MAQRANLMNPRMEHLLERVDSKFTLVTLSAMRAREINDYYNQLGEGLGKIVPPQVTSVSRKPLSIAMEEIEVGKIEIKRYKPVPRDCQACHADFHKGANPSRDRLVGLVEVKEDVSLPLLSSRLVARALPTALRVSSVSNDRNVKPVRSVAVTSPPGRRAGRPISVMRPSRRSEPSRRPRTTSPPTFTPSRSINGEPTPTRWGSAPAKSAPSRPAGPIRAPTCSPA